MGWFKVTKIWYVEAPTAGDALAITPPNPTGRFGLLRQRRPAGVMAEAQARRIEGDECCGGSGKARPGLEIPCTNPHCPVLGRWPEGST